MSYKIEVETDIHKAGEHEIFPVVFGDKDIAYDFGVAFFCKAPKGENPYSVKSWKVVPSKLKPAYTFRDGRLVRI